MYRLKNLREKDFTNGKMFGLILSELSYFRNTHDVNLFTLTRLLNKSRVKDLEFKWTQKLKNEYQSFIDSIIESINNEKK